MTLAELIKKAANMSLKDKELLARNIKRIMDSKDENQSSLAKKMKITRKVVNYLVNPKEKYNPDFKTLSRIAEALGVKIEDLFKG